MRLTLPDFFAELDGFTERIPLDFLTHRLTKLEVSLDEFRQYLQFGANTYRRNLIHEGLCYQALVLCWRSGQRSPIHDHRGSTCGVRVLSGVAIETLFDQTEGGWIYATGSHALGENQVCGSQDSDIHQVSNLRPRGENLVSLHIYSPALLVMGTYSLTDVTRGEFTDPIYAFADGAGI
ncbi:MAG: cysteine dioxygenase family protein [Candidatus Binatia bacterium]